MQEQLQLTEVYAHLLSAKINIDKLCQNPKIPVDPIEKLTTAFDLIDQAVDALPSLKELEEVELIEPQFSTDATN